MKSTAGSRITNGLVQEWVEHFLAKNRDYNSDQEEGQVFENADVLGIAGQFAEIWRKIWKLKKAMWDGMALTHEQPREILLDLIGHCFLAIDMLDRKAGKVRVTAGPVTEKVIPESGKALSLLVLTAEVIRAGEKAVLGDPKDLEDLGLFLKIVPVPRAETCFSCLPEEGEHHFGGNCKYRIATRRQT